MAIPVGNIIEIKTYSYLTDQVGINIRHFTIGANPGGGLDEQTVADELSNLVARVYTPWLPADGEYRGLTLQNKNLGPLAPTWISRVGAGQGKQTVEPMPGQVSGLISLKTAQGGRAGRGRVYMPFPSENFNGPGTKLNALGQAALDAIALMWGSPLGLVVGLAGTVLTPVIFHRATTTSTPVIGAKANARFATQRRRGAFGRVNPSPL